MPDTAEKTKKAPKEKLSPEDRRERVRSARAARVEAAFKGNKYEYVEEVSLGEGERYTDVTGNKGRHGHKIRDRRTGAEMIIGPASLKKLAEDYNAIKLPAKAPRQKKTDEASA